MMAEVPGWALHHLAEHLPDVVVLNARLCQRGVVLANTRLGAVVVTKSWWGEPRHRFLVSPHEQVTFPCEVCQQRLEFRRLDLPSLVHCGLCASKYFVDTTGQAELRERWPMVDGAAEAAAVPNGPLLFDGYTLYRHEVTLRNGGARTIYFFSKRTPAHGIPCARPGGYHVGVNPKSGLPFLKRGDTPDGERLLPEVVRSLRPQCRALTDEGLQCRNSARHSSQYCASHFGYQPPVMAKAQARREDTLPRVALAPDTLPAIRVRRRRA
ncbi:MAG: hypothetical protein ACYDBQ_06605 [Thermoplasmatota archaeon]